MAEDEQTGRDWHPGQRHAWSPAELKSIVDAEREFPAFIVLRDGEGEQVLVGFAELTDRFTVGRREGVDVLVDWDSEVSRLHCVIEGMGGQWTVSDDGLSRNGTFVNTERVSGSRRLGDGDVIMCGKTPILFRSGTRSSVATAIGDVQAAALKVTPAQRKVLAALAAPSISAGKLTAPASNAEIAAELYVSVETVKSHMKALVKLLDLEDVPSSQKRVRLVEEAMRMGIVSPQGP